MDQFYAQADVLLFSSLIEVTPMVISEAMSHFMPAITTDIAGIPEMIHDGVEGFFFHPDDSAKCVAAMATLTDNPHILSGIGWGVRGGGASTVSLTWASHMMSTAAWSSMWRRSVVGAQSWTGETD